MDQSPFSLRKEIKPGNHPLYEIIPYKQFKSELIVLSAYYFVNFSFLFSHGLKRGTNHRSKLVLIYFARHIKSKRQFV